MEFRSEETDSATGSQPLASGLFVELERIHPDDVDDLDEINPRVKEIGEATRKYLDTSKNFQRPFLAMDLCFLKDIGLIVEGEKYKYNESEDDKLLKLVLSMNDIVDLSNLVSLQGGTDVVRVNPAVPVPIWFRSANLILKYCDQKGRVVPFPIESPLDPENPDGESKPIFHFMLVDGREYQLYEEIYKYSIEKEGMQKGFLTSAKFSYEILRQRGFSGALTEDVVGKLIAHTIVMEKGLLRGVLVRNANSEDFNNTEIQEKYQIYT